MKTEHLIRALAADTVPGPSTARLAFQWLLPALAAAVFVLLLTLGPRDDLAAVFGNPISVMRFVLGLLLGGLALRALFQLARPGGTARALAPTLAVAGIAAGLWLWAWVVTPSEARGMALVGKTMVSCLVSIPLLSVLPVAALLFALRHAAPTSPVFAGGAAGLAGGGFAAAIYALHCTEDSPIFYVTWYGLAIVIVSLASATIGQRLLRW